MQLDKPINSNYAGLIVQIQKLVPLENCDFVQAAIILGNQVIVSKDTKVGDIGIYFPLECQLSETYLSTNNLYRKAELNSDNTKTGYFETNGRIRCVKFRGHKSEGLFMPYSSIEFTGTDQLNVGDEFDTLNKILICKKYVVVKNISGGGNRSSKAEKVSKIVDKQFRFHEDTGMLYKNLHRITPNSLIQISYKLHGTSGISSYILCKKNLTWYEKLIKKLGINIVDTEYDYIYSSRKVIKNDSMSADNHFYKVDIWGIAHSELAPFLEAGMTFYYEIVGYLPSGQMIQKDYDYGYVNPVQISPVTYKYEYNYGIFIYRITYTNTQGKVMEFSTQQVKDFCKSKGLQSVPELFYGYAKELSDERMTPENWRDKFLETIKNGYNEKDCYLCENTVPEEGCVVRIEGLEFEAYKQKSNRFYELETKLLDSGIENLEDNN